MKSVRVSIAFSVALAAAFASSFAAAEDSGWYGGINLGQSRAKIDDPRIVRALTGSGFAVTAITDDDRDRGGKLFGGYQFNRHFALEAGYFDLGQFGFTANTLPPGSLNGNIKLRGLNLDAVGYLPFTEKLSAFARIGANYAEAKDRFTGTGLVNVLNPNPNKRDTNYKAGLGLQYHVSNALAIRLEGERYRINDAVGNKGDVDLASIGLVYWFDAKKPVLVARSAPAEVVAPAPTPAPPPVIVAPPAPPPAPMPKKLTLATDSLFDFDKAIIKPEGKSSLDKFAADLSGVSFDVIAVTGHTDRLGPHAYNLKLSERRAEAVKAYLAESANIPIGKISATGVNGANPATKDGECKGRRANKKLIACLQPDRRVEIEVTGTR